MDRGPCGRFNPLRIGESVLTGWEIFTYHDGVYVSIPSASGSPYLLYHLQRSRPLERSFNPLRIGESVLTRSTEDDHFVAYHPVSIPSASGSPYLPLKRFESVVFYEKVSIPSASGSPYLLYVNLVVPPVIIVFQSPPHRGVRTYRQQLGLLFWWRTCFNPLRIGESVLTPGNLGLVALAGLVSIPSASGSPYLR